ncbi:protein of unknown function [Kyrpidia spormannii]|uniref:Uncharacterized protein n=1 Tax=Kyrpidia spormannii TaxID=2055160 RepID=A0A6F9EGL4_9BACL|nr:protein of unknown function [Kyrpidia spormannii]
MPMRNGNIPRRRSRLRLRLRS